MLAQARRNGYEISSAIANKEYRGNRKIVMAAVTQDGQALQQYASASDNLRADRNREVVMVATPQNGYAFQYAAGYLC